MYIVTINHENLQKMREESVSILEDCKLHVGFLKIDTNGYEDDILFLNHDPITEVLEYLCYSKVTIRYYISDVEVSLDEANKLHLNSLFGKADVDYKIVCSEITGYLWTDEKLNIGGHNLLNELKTFAGKYLILLVEVHE
jgi:hypothetical protein